MINKFITVISTIAFISCSSCQSDLKESSTNHQVLHASYHCLLDSLSNTDTLYIAHVSSGCFLLFKDTVKIYYNSDKLYAELAVYDDIRQKSATITDELNDASVVAYKKLEHAAVLYKPDNLISTSTYYYNIHVKSVQVSFKEHSNEFKDYSNFIESVFGRNRLKQFQQYAK
ncbi:MAG: hypothetical protein U0264_04835 [Candidatus Kapaibacterium sp.]